MKTFSKAFTASNSHAIESDVNSEFDFQEVIADDMEVIEDEGSDISRSMDTVDGLLSLESLIAGKTGKPSNQEKQLYALAGKFAVTGTALESSDIVPAVESYEQMHQAIFERVSVAQEGVVDSLKNVWTSFANVMKKFFMWFRGLEGKLKKIEEQINKLSEYGGDSRSITVSLPYSDSGRVLSVYGESFASFRKGIDESYAQNFKFASGIITRGLAFSTSGIGILKSIKQDKSVSDTLVEDTFRQYVDIFGPSFAQELGLKKTAAHGDFVTFISEPNIYGQQLEISTTVKVPTKETADIYIRGVKQFSIGCVESSDEFISKETSKVTWEVTISELKEFVKSNRQVLNKLDGVYRNWEKVYTKFTDLIHQQQSLNVSAKTNQHGGAGVDWVATGMSAVGALSSAVVGYNDVNRINSEIGKTVVRALLSVTTDFEEVMDLSISVLKRLAFDSSWHKEKQ